MWAVPSSTAFWTWWLGEILSSSKVFRCFTRSVGIGPRAPITTSTTVAFFSQSLSISTFRSSFWLILLSPGIASSSNHACFFLTTVISGMLWARCLSVWILKPREFWLLHFAALSRHCVPTIFRMQVDDISCTDFNVALKLLYYDALYNLSVQFYCMNWLSGLLSRLFLCIIGTYCLL